MTTPPPLLASLVERKPCDGIEAEIAAWDWLETKFGTEADDSVDRAYAADEMVDAFHAGTDWRFKRAATALEALATENGALREAVIQYRDDLCHPPSPDSKYRRLEMIAKLIGKE